MDFKTYYGMTHNPFEKQAAKIIETIDFKELNVRLKYLTEVLGIGLITGRPGAGKTVILRAYAESLNPNQYRVSYLPLSTVSVSDFYSQIAVSLGVEPAFRKSAKFRQIQERIIELHDIEHITPVFILDEAQYLSGPIYNELVLLTNFGMDAENKCLVILAGLPQLNQLLQRPQFESFRQRITIKYQVVGLEYAESQRYVQEKLKSAGILDDIISEEALKIIFTTSGGSIRRLDQMITKSLIIGAQQEKRVIDNELVYQANAEIALG